MTPEQITAFIHNHSWWTESCPVSHAFFGRAMYGFVEAGKYFCPCSLPIAILVYRDGFVDEITPEQEKLTAYHWIVERVRRDPAFLRNVRARHERIRERFLRQERALFRSMEHENNQKLAKRYRTLLETYIDHVRIGAGLECVDVFADTELPGLLRQSIPGRTERQRVDCAMTMAAPERLSFLENEERLLFSGAIALYSMKPRPITALAARKDSAILRHILRNLTTTTFWIRNNYKTARVLDEQYFFERMQEIAQRYPLPVLRTELHRFDTKTSRLRKQKTRLRRQYSLPPDLLRHFRILAFIGSWIDDRKALMTRSNHSWEAFSREVTRRTGVPLRETRWYEPEEYSALMQRRKRVLPSVIRSRVRKSVYVIERAGKGWKATSRFLYGRDADAVIRAFDKQERRTDIHGVVACAPVKRMRGTAQVVLDVAQTRFREGNILVTTMTRPEFVPLMRKAKAIVTDEGGLTCHAAVISRELGIPCIIGTKIATKVLRDGDRVEVDATKGTVRKI